MPRGPARVGGVLCIPVAAFRPSLPSGARYAAGSVANAGSDLTDGVVRLRPLDLEDTEEWMAGEDEQQIRWFEFPGPASRQNVIEAIERWTESWRTNGPVRNWAVCDVTTGRILGGVEIR